MSKEFLPPLVGRLLQKNKIPFDKAELSFQIQSHPSYPSLHAITGVLDHFKIENVAARIPKDHESLNQLPDTFLAQLEADMVVATRLKKGYRITGLEGRTETLSSEEFVEKFGGIVVAVEPSEANTHKPQSSPVSKILAGAIGLILLTFLFISSPAPASLIFLTLSLIGAGISLAIVREESGVSTALGNAFCSDASEKKDCSAVLNSDGATLFGKYKISDLSMVYFSTMSIVSFISIVQGLSLELIYYMSLLAAPVTFYSIYYQWKVVKQWCMLCLSIVGLLWIQTGLSFYFMSFSPNIPLEQGLLAALVGLTAFAAWTYSRSQQDSLNETDKERKSLFKFKRNFDMFSAMLEKFDAIDTAIPNTTEIVLGNPNALTEITVVSSPFCIHCKPVHSHIEDILGRFSDQVRIVVRFNIKLQTADSELVQISSRLLEIYEKQGKEICLMAMNEIYGDASPTEWLEKWSECSEPERYFKTLEAEKNWCSALNVNFTPEIFVNGHPYPKGYERTDLIYFIEDLNEVALSITTQSEGATAHVDA